MVDNGSSHRGKAAADRLSARFPNAVMVHTPVHASWLNQVEIYFSILQRKALSPNDFTSLDQVEDRLTAFERRYNETARPFEWEFTHDDGMSVQQSRRRAEGCRRSSWTTDPNSRDPAARLRCWIRSTACAGGSSPPPLAGIR
ncbi:transposase [Nocardia sp. SYP-A9097]|uniref:transposase n=1 Tax=Nocardia sp. SYP-A9097 TaxID=2663237 RepID=UPI0028165AD6|nr:transposase [Nocardia sp. SYP-A9097]